ncbi:hypothetical protein LWI29_008402 [Acer saccharum]|uniref:glutathione transferase n=1 Tax=Acer saccharum TaxID=4024 RepID=A0AA39SUZ4_ACESA|nr:hypothetical protein LWI29_008402 [Acer saccharum]
MVDSDWNCVVKHVYREGNRLADGLAHLGHNMKNEIMFFEDPPPQIFSIYEDDCRESLVILEYIEDTWNHNPLLPQDPYHKATARFWVKFGDDKVLPSIWNAFIKQGKELEDAIDEAIENLKLLEEQLKGKKFFGGEKIGLADLALGWLANLVPVFEAIIESLVILEYIEDTWNHNPLLPQDPYHKATARFWVKFGDDKVLPSVWSAFIKQGKEQEDAIDEAIENLKLLEEQLKGKKFFGGEKIGLADLAFGWLANLVPVFEEIIGMKIIDEERFPSLLAWMHEFSQVAIIKESWPPRDKLIIKFQAFRAI